MLAQYLSQFIPLTRMGKNEIKNPLEVRTTLLVVGNEFSGPNHLSAKFRKSL